MPLPVAVGWLVAALGRWATRLLIPILIAVGGWVLEQMTGALSWVFLRIGSAVVTLIVVELARVQMPSPPDWAGVFGSQMLDLVEVAGVDVALGVLIASALLRLVVSVVTLGRF